MASGAKSTLSSANRFKGTSHAPRSQVRIDSDTLFLTRGKRLGWRSRRCDPCETRIAQGGRCRQRVAACPVLSPRSCDCGSVVRELSSFSRCPPVSSSVAGRQSIVIGSCSEPEKGSHHSRTTRTFSARPDFDRAKSIVENTPLDELQQVWTAGACSRHPFSIAHFRNRARCNLPRALPRLTACSTSSACCRLPHGTLGGQ